MSTPKQPGKLMLLSTHIGDVRDIPQRSLEALRSSDLLIFEEDRPARLALKAAGLAAQSYLKFSEHHQAQTLAAAAVALKNGQCVTYMSDQGSPTLADPGAALVHLAYQVGAQIQVIPGPSAIVAALCAWPLPLVRFGYAGFLPQERGKRRDALVALARRPEVQVLLDTPYRLGALLADVAEVYPAGRKGLVALDVTGPREGFYFGAVRDLLKRVPAGEKLNFVLVLEGA